MNAYHKDLQAAIKRLHGCDSTHEAATPVVETFRGRIVWQGQVDAFALKGHPKARRCYAWSHAEGKERRYFAVLEVPPIDSPLAAVRAAIVGDGKMRNRAGRRGVCI